MKPGNIELHIEELVLHGFSPGDRYRIAEAVEQELVRLLSARDIPQLLTRNVEIDRLDGGGFDSAPDSGAKTIGSQVAKAVYEGLNQSDDRIK